MEKYVSLKLGAVLALLTVAGFFLKQKHLLRLMNIDTTHSMLRLPLTAALLYGGTNTDLKTTRKVLFAIGLFYMAMGSAGTVDKRVGGLLPSGLTNFDIVYHFAVGAGALWLGVRSGRMMKP